MSTNTPTEQRFRVYRVEGTKKQLNTELPLETYRQMQALAQHRGWSMSETSRRAIGLFLAQNKDILDILLSEHDGRTGR